MSELSNEEVEMDVSFSTSEKDAVAGSTNRGVDFFKDTKIDNYIELSEIIDNVSLELQFKYPPAHNPELKITIENWQIEASRRQEAILEQIRKLFLKLSRNVEASEGPVISIRNCRNWSNCAFDETLALKSDQNVKMTQIKFTSTRSIKRFSLMYFILGKIYKLLATNTTITQRELYYQNKTKSTLFKSQQTINCMLNDISCLLNCSIFDLNVCTTSKGFVQGPLTLITSTYVLNFNEANATAIPHDVFNIIDLKSEAKFVIIIEKEAVFKVMTSSDMMKKLPPCLLITGRGYPDINTRVLLKKIWAILSLPIFALVDPNPAGIEIMCVYRFGSLNMSHQVEQLAVPSMRWLGVFPTEIRTMYGSSVPLTAREKAKIKSLLKRPYIIANPNIKNEVSDMLEYNYRAETEALELFCRDYLTSNYLFNKLLTVDFM